MFNLILIKPWSNFELTRNTEDRRTSLTTPWENRQIPQVGHCAEQLAQNRQKLNVSGGWGGGRWWDELGVWDWHVHTAVVKIDNWQGLLYSTGNAAQYPIINHNGKEYGKECMHMYNWITLLYSRNEHNILNQLYFNKINLKEETSGAVPPSQTAPDKPSSGHLPPRWPPAAWVTLLKVGGAT